MNTVNPDATPKTPICHSSRQVEPIQPEPNNIPPASPITPALASLVKYPNINSKPTIASMMVKRTIAHQRISGVLTRYSMTGFMPNEFGRKWLNFSPIYPGASSTSLFSRTNLRQNAEK